MLIAEFSAPADLRARPASRPRSNVRVAKPRNRALIAWLIAGLAALVLVPFARGDRLLGATLPFWLVAAPLIDLAWIERERIVRSIRAWLRGARRAPRMARRQRASRVVAWSSERS
jgi:hypothetical protein